MSAFIDLQEKQTILIVDDTPDNISLLAALLKGKYKIKIATNGLKALQIVSHPPYPDLILLDVMMPEMDGHETCRRLKANPDTAPIPVIFLTAKSQVEDEETGLNLGAVDYIAKPISPPIVFARVANQLSLSNARRLLEQQEQHLEILVQQRTRQLLQMQQATLMALAQLAGSRVQENQGNIRRVQRLTQWLAQQAVQAALTDLSPLQIEHLSRAAALHDIGMLAAPDGILQKPGKLDEAEFAAVRLHTSHGAQALSSLANEYPLAAEYLHCAAQIAASHHERWDGKGYPEGRAGEHIPFVARLVALADVYDALISPRSYKPAYAHEQALRILQEGRGTHFDPALLDLILAQPQAWCEQADAMDI
ncbi:HD domain-containing phosphohydrolase [Massilia sp. W12]|uniref:response regulator n=1 Tax=Massilia sp. W12 TaxID=3126507 RepID=UPI0030CD16E2